MRPSPGALLPTEEELVRRLGVSRSTVRSGACSRAGPVERQPALGTVVAEAPCAETFCWHDSFVLSLLDEG